MVYRNVRLLAGIMLLLGAAPAVAQQAATGRIASSAVGEAGQRQMREEPVAGIEPVSRVSSRIQNRVQSRIRNRIDRYYDPQANANSPFDVASDQARTAAAARRR